MTSGRKPTRKKSPASFHPMPASELSNCTESPRFIIISLLPNTTCLHTKLLVRSSYRHTKKGENRDYCRSFGGHPYIQLRTQKREPFSVHIPSMAAPLSWVERLISPCLQEIGGLRVGPTQLRTHSLHASCTTAHASVITVVRVHIHHLSGCNHVE